MTRARRKEGEKKKKGEEEEKEMRGEEKVWGGGGASVGKPQLRQPTSVCRASTVKSGDDLP